MDAYELLRRVHDRGGQVRVLANAVQYRPKQVVTADELRWLQNHREAVIRAVRGIDRMNSDNYRRWVTERFGLCDAVGKVRPGHLILLPRSRDERRKMNVSGG